jgi:acyl carrier protein
VDVHSELIQAISQVCDVPADRIHNDSRVDELGFDSLASAEVLTDLEIRSGRQLPIDALRRLVRARTVGDVARLLEQELIAPGAQLES